jgi:hypothetical protein
MPAEPRPCVGSVIGVTGPDRPDAVFRHCLDGRHAAVRAMDHDPGHRFSEDS